MADFEKQHETVVDDDVGENFHKLSQKIDGLFEQRHKDMKDMKSLHETVINEQEKSQQSMMKLEMDSLPSILQGFMNLQVPVMKRDQWCQTE